MKILLLTLLSFTNLSLASTFYEIKEAESYTPYFYSVSTSSEQHRIAAHLWSNNNKKLLVLVHGYLDNCAYPKPLQRWFLTQGHDVLCLELPGHGESTGGRADISAMEEYYQIFQLIFPQVFALHYRSFSFFAHSTGNVGMIELLLRNEEHKFENIIMATPLIRSYLWKLSRFGHRVFGKILRRVPKRPASLDDPEYKRLAKLDPKPFKSVPLNWYKQLIKWNEILSEDSRSSQENVSVIFGSEDKTIDFPFNKRFMEQRFPNAEINVIRGSGHTLHYQKEEYRNEFFKILKNILK
ncbi:MAG: alpha/beta hydrolase [Bacteriovoracia bacterium]